jgi:hypothetical protein
MPADTVLIRLAAPADADAIARLAALDSSPVPTGDLLLAEADGALRAALRLDDRAVIADPFARTAGLVELLDARADHLHGRRGARERLALWSQLWHRAATMRPSV